LSHPPLEWRNNERQSRYNEQETGRHEYLADRVCKNADNEGKEAGCSMPSKAIPGLDKLRKKSYTEGSKAVYSMLFRLYPAQKYKT